MVKAKSSEWFEVKIQMEKMTENGMKEVKESYVVDALSFTEAEKVITEEITPFIAGEFKVLEEKRAKYKEVVLIDDDEADKWWKVKMELVVFDEKSEKEKKTAVHYLVQAKSNAEAHKVMEEFTKDCMVECRVLDVTATAFLDVYMHGGRESVFG